MRDKYGAIIRGDVTAKKLALVFTGDERGESTAPILDALKERKVQGRRSSSLAIFCVRRSCDRC